MKLREILRFELSDQIRSVSTWLYFAILVFVAFRSIRGNYIYDARNGDFLLNAPYAIAATTVLASLLWLLMAAAVAGKASARDLQTRMHPLIYTAPVSKAEYLGGRFLAAFVLNALLLLAVPAGILLALRLPGVEAEILGPSMPAAYVSAYVFIALPTAFAATAVQFSLAVLCRRAAASYLGSLALFVIAYIVAGVVAVPLRMPTLGHLLDPVGMVTVVGHISKAWTPIEKNTRLVGLEGPMLANGLLWFGIGLCMLALTHRRFRFAHPAAGPSRRRRTRRRESLPPTTGGSGIARSTPISVPQVRRRFGFATHVRQALAIACRSLPTIARSRGGLVLLTPIAILAGLYILGHMKLMGVPLIPRTDHVLTYLTAPLTDTRTAWIIIPLLTVYLAGEVVWREREAGMSEIPDAAPVPEWAFFLGKLLALGLVLVVWEVLLTTAGVLVQVGMGYHDLEIERYLQVLFGLQLADYVLFALLALVVHSLVRQKHFGYLVALLAYGFIAFASTFDIRHNLIVYGADPGWAYTDMRGFGPSLGPWLWFKLYWSAWALLLAVVARLLWPRGSDLRFRVRLGRIRRRFTPPTAWAATAAIGLILTLGGWIFYNTNVLNAYRTAADRTEQRAEYELRYGRYANIPQPRLSGTGLDVEIDPERRQIEIRGTYHLVNRSTVPIGTVHVATAQDVETRALAFHPPAALRFADEALGHRVYDLESPLLPGDSLQLDFEVRSEQRGFGNAGVDSSVIANGTYFTNLDSLPAIGYQAGREIRDAGARRSFGLPPRPLRSPHDAGSRADRVGDERIAFEAVVGTEKDQIAVAPGTLRETWTKGGRRYFRYATDAPIPNQYAFFSADYEVHEGRWSDPSAGSDRVVTIQIFHHPKHATRLDQIVRSVEASLTYHAEHFGPYPYGTFKLVERPGHGFGMHAEATTVDYREGFSLLDPDDGPRGLDLPFYVVAHEVAHQWWGAAQLVPERVEGAGLLVESLAVYSGIKVLEAAYGYEHLRRYLSQLRASYQVPRTRAAVPLLRAVDPFLTYRKGPLVLYALGRYIGEDRVNEALRHLLAKHASGEPPLPTSVDLYRELQAVTPDTLHGLLHDLFEANTFWELETKRATVEQTDSGTWRVTLAVAARKVVVDTTGVETEVPMDDWVEIGVFAPTREGEELGRPLHVRMHRIQARAQTITVTVPHEPARAGIDPHHLLIDLKVDDNLKSLRTEG